MPRQPYLVRQETKSYSLKAAVRKPLSARPEIRLKLMTNTQPSFRRVLCRLIFVMMILPLGLEPALAQQTSGELRGQITDELGGLIVGATLTLTDSEGAKRNATTNGEGRYLFYGLPRGKYSLRAEAHGFALYENDEVLIEPGRREQLNIKLSVAIEQQVVNVTPESTLSTASESNAGAIVMSGAQMEALPDDPDELAAALQALAGPSAGPTGGEIFIDGFSGTRTPPRSSIREVRINSNPFSAEYSRLGFGRIEILTRPGTEKFHGQFNFNFSNQSLNSRNPFAKNRAPYRYLIFAGNLGGSLMAKRASFFLDFERDDINDNATINATVLDSSLNVTTLGFGLTRPLRRTAFSPRLDYQINQKNTLVARYSIFRQTLRNAGVGNFALPSLAYDAANTDQSVQLTETAVLSARVLNETRFQFTRRDANQNGAASGPTINVLDAFTGGGSPISLTSNLEDRSELQNYTTFVLGHHTVKAGARLRTILIKNLSLVNFNGTFTFLSLTQYRNTLLGMPGASPAQFSIFAGDPAARVNQTEYSLFIQDEWSLRPNLTLSMGLRYDAQTNVHSRLNFAPRFAFAYAPKAPAGSKAKTVIRGGFGIFFDRVGENLLLQAERFDREQQFVTSDANLLEMFPLVPPLAALANSSDARTTVRLAPNLQLPYVMQGAIGLERELPLKFIFTATFLSARALHLLRSRNINAPFPLTNVRPLGSALGNVFEYESSGRFNQNQLILGLRNPLNSKMSIIATYILNRAMSDTDGPDTFPANSYNLGGEYGRSDLDIRQRLTITGVFSFKHGLSLNPFILASSGRPFNIITGRDTNGDTLFTERPSFATSSNQAGVMLTRFGALNPSPLPGEQIIPRNYGTSAAFFTVNLRASKTWSFGTMRSSAAAQQRRQQTTRNGNRNAAQAASTAGSGSILPDSSRSDYFGRASSESRYKLTVSVVARNIFNRTNYGRAIGNLNSLLFGRSNFLAPPYGYGDGSDPNAANRRIEVQMRFAF